MFTDRVKAKLDPMLFFFYLSWIIVIYNHFFFSLLLLLSLAIPHSTQPNYITNGKKNLNQSAAGK